MPSPSTIIDFPPCRLDLRAGQLRRDGVPVRLRPKTFTDLRAAAALLSVRDSPAAQRHGETTEL